MHLQHGKKYKREDGSTTKVISTGFQGFLAFQSDDGFYYSHEGRTRHENKNITEQLKERYKITTLDKITIAQVILIGLIIWAVYK